MGKKIKYEKAKNQTQNSYLWNNQTIKQMNTQ